LEIIAEDEKETGKCALRGGESAGGGRGGRNSKSAEREVETNNKFPMF